MAHRYMGILGNCGEENKLVDYKRCRIAIQRQLFLFFKGKRNSVGRQLNMDQKEQIDAEGEGEEHGEDEGNGEENDEEEKPMDKGQAELQSIKQEVKEEEEELSIEEDEDGSIKQEVEGEI